MALGDPAGAASPAIVRIDLAKPFDTRSDWRLVATQGPPTVDYGENPAPGAIDLCFEKGPAGDCVGDPSPMPPPDSAYPNGIWPPHYLTFAKPVYPRGPSATPLLMIVTASVHSGDGDQVAVTQLFAYERARDTFVRVYAHATGRNNNQEDRFMPAGPLRGGVISAAQTENAPYAYWIELRTLTPAYTYRRVLRYRSATRYGDGNPLPVIDSEMANIERRLGLWRPGAPLPTPPGPCPKPRLVQMELWCN